MYLSLPLSTVPHPLPQQIIVLDFQFASPDSSLPLDVPRPFLAPTLPFMPFIRILATVGSMIPLACRMSFSPPENYCCFCPQESFFGVLVRSRLSGLEGHRTRGQAKGRESQTCRFNPANSISDHPWKGVLEYSYPSSFKKRLKQCLLMAHHENER